MDYLFGNKKFDCCTIMYISGDLEALQDYREALLRRRQAMGRRQDEELKQHEGKVMMQNDLEVAREKVARMAKEKAKASKR